MCVFRHGCHGNIHILGAKYHVIGIGVASTREHEKQPQYTDTYSIFLHSPNQLLKEPFSLSVMI